MTDDVRQRVLRVLHLEDSDLDHELAMAHLQRAGLQVQSQRIESRAEFAAALDGDWDLILSDYNLPGFSGLQALDMLRDSGRLWPFILVSGEIGEDTAVEAMRNGASDYLLKNNLARLAPAMEHAIEAAEARRARVAADEELQASRQRLAELAQHLQTSVELERSAIAREIHDDVGGSLTALNFDLAWIARHADSEPVRARATAALETVTHAIESSQRIMHNLRPAILEQGLVAALQWMASRYEKRTGIECSFHTSHDSLQLPAGVPLVAYRTAQEALTNVSKHAQATRVRLDLMLAPDMLSLDISDNGRGLSSRDLAKARSFGIRGLQERAVTVGGWIDLSSSALGTTLILSIPIDSSASEAPVARDEEAESAHDPSAWGTL
jgi:signal transduction histidine kinase